MSSVASERGFSTNKFNHSVLRNRLSAARVGKLNFITFNGKQFASSDFNYEELDVYKYGCYVMEVEICSLKTAFRFLF